MGYACPVCEVPQADGEHLANHLAFTAMLGDDDHEAWLDDHVPDWAECDPATLAEQVVDLATERAFPQVFEDTTGGDAPPDRGATGDADSPAPVVDGEAPGSDAVPSDVFSDALELTRRRRATADQPDDGQPNDGQPDDGDTRGADERGGASERETDRGQEAENTASEDEDGAGEDGASVGAASARDNESGTGGS